MGRMLKAFRCLLIILSALVFILGGLGAFRAHQFAQYANPSEVSVVINKGASVKKIADQLKEQNIIRDALLFEAFVRLFSKGRFIRAGEYEFAQGLKLRGIVERLLCGKVLRHKLTIPEGFRASEICALLVAKKMTPADACLARVQDIGFLKEPAGATSLEGYLFPETYFYERDDTLVSLLEQMTQLFYQKVENALTRSDRQTTRPLHQLVTLASIIEKETAVAQERRLIAGVFVNRLDRGMLLQSDPTVIYGIDNYDGNIRKSDLEKDTPYNTYTRTGLPSGPICNPGLASLEAAINPERTPFLYFVAKGDGSHHFSETLTEHNRAVSEYQRRRPKANDTTADKGE